MLDKSRWKQIVLAAHRIVVLLEEKEEKKVNIIKKIEE